MISGPLVRGLGGDINIFELNTEDPELKHDDEENSGLVDEEEDLTNLRV